MSDYNLHHLLSTFWSINPKSIEINQSKIDAWIEQYVQVSNPDFLIVFDMSNLENPILFQKNYKLKSAQDQEVNLFSIIDAVDKDSASKIFKADERVIMFAKQCYARPRRVSYRLRFNAHFFPNQPRSLVRDMTILARDTDNKPNLILIAFFDVTELYGKQSSLQVDIKRYDDETPDLEFDILKKDLKEIISPLIKITKREKEILELISHGKTSGEIAEELIISVATVNTHRQNLIRKHNVNNTSAILKTL
jgi:DNA-binding CsgD family transcriptional regulator